MSSTPKPLKIDDNNYHLHQEAPFMQHIALTALQPGESAIVQGFSADMPTDCRKLLQHLGITRKAEITLVRRAPLGDPLQIQVLGSQISLRASEAQHIYITRPHKL